MEASDTPFRSPKPSPSIKPIHGANSAFATNGHELDLADSLMNPVTAA